MDQLQTIEPHMQDILMALRIATGQHLVGLTDEARRRKLAKLVRDELNRLLDGGAAMSMDGPSLETPAMDRAADILTHRMGVYMPPERRR